VDDTQWKSQYRTKAVTAVSCPHRSVVEGRQDKMGKGKAGRRRVRWAGTLEADVLGLTGQTTPLKVSAVNLSRGSYSQYVKPCEQ
jgi:hypothetical protein